MSTIPILPAHISTVLITGAGGYVGREVALLLLERYPTLNLVLTDLKAPLPVGNAKLLAADLCQSGEVDKIFQEHTIDAVSFPMRMCQLKGRTCVKIRERPTDYLLSFPMVRLSLSKESCREVP